MILHHIKHSNFPFAIFTEFDIGLDTFKVYEAFKFHIVLSFADKPKLAYLTNLPKNNKKRANCLQKLTQIQI
jgi:hypothetical protein